jgi:hypothetical protein
MPSRRRRQKPSDAGMVDEIAMVRDEHSAEPGEGFDLGNIAPNYDELKALAFKAKGINPLEPDAWHRLRFALYREARKHKRGPKAKSLSFWIDCTRAGVTDDDNLSTAAQKLMKLRGLKAGQKSIERRIKRYRKILAVNREKVRAMHRSREGEKN